MSLTIFCQQPEVHLLRVADVTKISEEYPHMSAITYWRFSLFRDDKLVLTATTDDARAKDWLIDSRDYGLAQFNSDVYDIRLEIIGKPIGSRQLANYFIRTPVKPTDKVWIKKNGAYYDFTHEGVIENGDWTWKVLGTYDLYELFQVRTGKDVYTEPVIADVLQATTYDNTGETVLLSASQSRVFCRAHRNVYAELVLGQVRIWLAGTSSKTSKNVADADAKLALIDQRLDLLESGAILDMGIAKKLLQLVKTALTTWKN